MTSMRPPNKTVLLKVVILGDGGVGKSCLMNRFVSNRFDENNFHTIGVEFMNKDIEIDSEKYTLQIWDTAGQERYRALRTPFYRGSDICLLCYSTDNIDSFRGLKTWRDEFLAYADVKTDKFPFIVVGNKNDMSPRYQQVDSQEVAQWCKDNAISSFIETSSKTAMNVTEAFVLGVRQWKHMERVAEIELRQQHGDTIDLSKTIRLAQNRFCCSGASSNTSSETVERDIMPDDSINTPSPRLFGRRNQRQPPNSMNYQL